MKQNFRYITEQLPECADDPILQAVMTERDWDLASVLNSWICSGGYNHTQVVLWVRRSLTVFDRDTRCLPLGSCAVFSERVMRKIKEQQLPLTWESAEAVLPKESQEFCYRLNAPLSQRDVDRIENKTA